MGNSFPPILFHFDPRPQFSDIGNYFWLFLTKHSVILALHATPLGKMNKFTYTENIPISLGRLTKF